MNAKLPSLSVNCGSVYSTQVSRQIVLLHLKAGDGDLVPIT